MPKSAPSRVRRVQDLRSSGAAGVHDHRPTRANEHATAIADHDDDGRVFIDPATADYLRGLVLRAHQHGAGSVTVPILVGTLAAVLGVELAEDGEC